MKPTITFAALFFFLLSSCNFIEEQIDPCTAKYNEAISLLKDARGELQSYIDREQDFEQLPEEKQTQLMIDALSTITNIDRLEKEMEKDCPPAYEKYTNKKTDMVIQFIADNLKRLNDKKGEEVPTEETEEVENE